MNDEVLDALCDAWKIDRELLRDAVTACQMTITRIIPDHPQCSQMHVGIVLCAQSLSQIKAVSTQHADIVAASLGGELYALTTK